LHIIDRFSTTVYINLTFSCHSYHLKSPFLSGMETAPIRVNNSVTLLLLAFDTYTG